MAVFVDPPESQFYASCVRQFVFDRSAAGGALQPGIVECGTGTGSELAEIVTGCGFAGNIRGFELERETYGVAQRTIEAAGVGDRYHVVHGDFFDQAVTLSPRWVISDPPYLPSRDGDIKAPQLWGGPDGSAVTKRILACGFPRAMVMVSSYSDPVRVIEFARTVGYTMRSWVVMPLPFGEYSSEPVVAERIAEMQAEGTAFVSDQGYWLAGVDWSREAFEPDQSEALIRAFRGLGRPTDHAPATAGFPT